MSRRVAAVAICVLLPLTLAAADPRGDTVPCVGAHGPGDPPDLIAAVGQASEGGSSAIWHLVFAQPLRVPDPTDPPFRVDVVIRDPKVPTVSVGTYRRFNRIVRFDATGADAPVKLLFIAEGGSTVFDPPTIDGDTMTIRMPGRLLLGADEFGRSAMQRLRWSVVVRDGGRCDLLGDGVPSLRLAAGPTPSIGPSSPAPTDRGTEIAGSFDGGQAVAVVAVLVAVAILVAVVRRRR